MSNLGEIVLTPQQAKVIVRNNVYVQARAASNEMAYGFIDKMFESFTNEIKGPITVKELENKVASLSNDIRNKRTDKFNLSAYERGLMAMASDSDFADVANSIVPKFDKYDLIAAKVTIPAPAAPTAPAATTASKPKAAATASAKAPSKNKTGAKAAAPKPAAPAASPAAGTESATAQNEPEVTTQEIAAPQAEEEPQITAEQAQAEIEKRNKQQLKEAGISENKENNSMLSMIFKMLFGANESLFATIATSPFKLIANIFGFAPEQRKIKDAQEIRKEILADTEKQILEIGKKAVLEGQAPGTPAPEEGKIQQFQFSPEMHAKVVAIRKDVLSKINTYANEKINNSSGYDKEEILQQAHEMLQSAFKGLEVHSSDMRFERNLSALSVVNFTGISGGQSSSLNDVKQNPVSSDNSASADNQQKPTLSING